MNKNLFPCIWFDSQAKEAADFYCSVFSNSKIIVTNPIVTNLEIAGFKLMTLNGGPMFVPNPSVSFFVYCETDEEIINIWQKLSVDATIMMPLGEYPWSKNYAFFKDKFQVSWQLMLATELPVKQKIVPSLLFVGNSFGKAKEATDFYMSVMPNSAMIAQTMYEEVEIQSEGKVKFSKFVLNGNEYTAMDGVGDHKFGFNEAMSIVIQCETQQEIDFYWNSFTKNGGDESMCGWCKDKFGVSWQVVPTILGQLISDPEKGPRVIQAFMKMKKFVIQDLLEA